MSNLKKRKLRSTLDDVKYSDLSSIVERDQRIDLSVGEILKIMNSTLNSGKTVIYFKNKYIKDRVLELIQTIKENTSKFSKLKIEEGLTPKHYIKLEIE